MTDMIRYCLDQGLVSKLASSIEPEKVSLCLIPDPCAIISSFIAVFEPTSDVKACKLIHVLEQVSRGGSRPGSLITHMAPNRQELLALYDAALTNGLEDTLSLNDNEAQKDVPAWLKDPRTLQAALQALSLAENVWLKAGADGLCLFRRSGPSSAGKVSWTIGATGPSDAVEATYFEPLSIKDQDIRNAIGAGDSMLGGILAGLSHGLTMEDPAYVNKLAQLGQSWVETTPCEYCSFC